MKKIAIFVLIIMTVLGNARAVSAAEVPKEIRVGLETRLKEQAVISIGNKSLAVGYEVNKTFIDSGIISAKSNFAVTPSGSYYVRLSVAYPTHEIAELDAENYINQGIPAIPCLIAANTWVVYLGGFGTENEAMNASYSVNDGAAVVAPNGRIIALTDGGVTVALFDNASSFAQFRGDDSITISLGDRKYRGRMEFGRYAGKNITAVNVISMDQYLYGVVPSEMPKSFNIEALKAQAVAARTYAMTKLGAHTADGYELCDTTSCQVYLGATNEAENTTFAVDATKDILIYYNGSPIQAFFSASSGGYTENSENVWTEALPYLRAVPEINETTAKQWVRTFSLAELSKLLTDNNVLIGSAKSVSISKISDSGRVQELVISGTGGEKVLKKEEIRTFFSKSTDGLLNSRMFTLANGVASSIPTMVYVTNGLSSVQNQLNQAQVINSSGTLTSVSNIGNSIVVIGSSGAANVTATYSPTQITVVSGGAGQTDAVTFVGSGNGHGVGLSQHGANGMAEMGYTYEQILKYYYTGVEVR